MGRFLSWTAVLLAVYLVTFEEDLTRAYHLPEYKASTTEKQSFSSMESKDSKHRYAEKTDTSKNSLPQVNGKQLDSTNQTEKDLIPQPQSTASGNKRALPAAALAVLKNPKVQEAVIDKGIEVVGKLVDKQFENIERAQNKAADFLKKEVKLDITPDKAWINDNMFVPSAYHLDASVEGGAKSPEEKGDPPFVYPAGMGQVLMNGCWGKDYKIGDPCYNARENSSICRDMIDGAAFIGVGFDGSGTYSPESRKMSIVQRNCANKATYDNLDVPDTMNVHGVYDTSAFMMTFESRTQYQQYLQHEAGVSGSVFGFSAGVKKAWGGSMQASTQQYMAVLDVDVDRYEIFMDEVKPSDLSLSFLREFMDLPISYFHPGAQVKYQNFIQRWGTHYIKSAKFGGQLEIVKTMVASQVASKSEFAEKMEAEYRGLFASAGAKSSTQGGQESKAENKFTSTSVMAQGGSQEIATMLADVYSPTFKSDFKEWLQSIPAYPKAFRFLLGTIADLVNFRANDLFLGEDIDWGCEGNSKNLVEETKGETTKRYYTVTDTDGNLKKFYCPFQDREALDVALRKKRASLQRAIEIYMDEGPISVSDMVIAECQSSDKTSDVNDDFLANTRVPTWKKITQQNSTITVSFDMENDLARGSDGLVKIQKNMTREVRFTRGRWFTADKNGKFHVYSGYRNGKSAELRKHKLSIFGLVLSYNSKYGSLDLTEEDFNESKKIYPTLREEMIGLSLARLTVLHSDSFGPEKRQSAPTPAVTPCNVKWSNALRLDPTTTGGRCLHFTASSAGDLFVVFATIPSQRNSWYYVQIGVSKVSIYKGENELTSTSDTGAVSIGDTLLYQSYFVCLYEKPDSTLIEYGKTLGTSDGGDIYLMHLDTNNPLNVRFYAFGNMNKAVKIWDAHIAPRDLTDADCKGSTYKDLPTNLCVQKCHQYCDPFAGCRNPGAEDLQPSDCLACRVAKDPLTNTCLEKCPKDTNPVEGKECLATFDAKTVYTEPTAPLLRLNDMGGVAVQNMPALNHLTLCLWTKMPQTSVVGFRNNHLVRYHEQSTEKGFVLNFLHWDGTTIPPTGAFSVGDKAFLFSKRFLDDYKWHHVCVTWNGVTGVTVAYIDGVRDNTGKGGTGTPGGIMKDSLPGGGTLKVLGYYSQVVYLTEVNLWNIVLSAQEIAESSKRCLGKPGNVKKWSDFWHGFSQDNSKYDSPSQCKSLQAGGEGMTEEGAVASENPQKQSSGNKRYHLNLRKKAALKYTEKEQKNSKSIS